MIRADAITYLNGRYQALIEALKIRPDDTPSGLGPSVDGAWLEQGLARTADTTADQERRTWALLRVHFLTHALERAAVLVDIQADDPMVRASRSQVFKQIESALKVAQADAAAVVADESGASDMSVFRLNLDWTQDMPA